ncbi:unnamed protein product [Caenorhabditis angaria]|uniref:Carboxylesterase type B domain-containing protein n=1 Tax=Caenorhabditis angaria TaxID=860376 RepID=A0A9P1IH82_9PELO|nr:unnamed protein product [Caenorhabditis angaria]
MRMNLNLFLNLIISILGLLVSLTSCQQQNYVTCNTAQGPVRGQTVDLGSDQSQLYSGRADVFTGIPYCQPPVNNLRFEPPQSISTFNSSVYDATSFKPKCPQTGLSGQQQQTSEDCLYLNIYTPNANGNGGTQMAVMIMIDGYNGFQNGGCDQSQVKGIVSNLVQRQIIVVTLQYRLGALGFFTTYTNTIQSNLGMLDQVEAIKWVKTNIHNFGGDPNKITVAGQNDGACAVSAHTLSPMSQGLINQAIISSGSIYSCYNPTPIVPGTQAPQGATQASSTVSPAGSQPMYDQASVGNAGYYQNTQTSTSSYNSASSSAQVFQDPSQQLASTLCNQTWTLQNMQNIQNCLKNYTVDFFVNQKPGGPTATWMIVRDTSFLPGSIDSLSSRRPNIPIIIGTVQDEDADYAFKLINTGKAQDSDNLDNWIFDFARKNKLNSTQTQNVSNIIGQNYEVDTGAGNTVQRDQPVQNLGQNQGQAYGQANQGQVQNQQFTSATSQIVYVNQYSGFGQANQNQYGNQQNQNSQNFNQNQNSNQNSQIYSSGTSQNQYGNQQMSSQNQNYQNFNQNQYSSGTSQNQYGNQNSQIYSSGNQQIYNQNQNSQNQNQYGNQQNTYNLQRDPSNNQQNSGSSYTSLQTITQIASDQSTSLTTTQIQSYMQNGNSVVRIYQFTYVSDVGRSTVPQTSDNWKPVFRGQDMYFLTMSETIWTTSNYTAEDRHVANQMGQQWSDFVKTGQVQNWSPTTSGNYNYCNLNSQPSQNQNYGQEARKVFQDQINPICQEAQNNFAIANNLTVPYSTSSSSYSNPLGTVVSKTPANVQYSNDAQNGQNFHITFQVQGFPNGK